MQYAVSMRLECHICMDRVIDADASLTWGCRYREMSVSNKSYDPLELYCGRDRVRGLTDGCVPLGEMGIMARIRARRNGS